MLQQKAVFDQKTFRYSCQQMHHDQSTALPNPHDHSIIESKRKCSFKKGTKFSPLLQRTVVFFHSCQFYRPQRRDQSKMLPHFHGHTIIFISCNRNNHFYFMQSKQSFSFHAIETIVFNSCNRNNRFHFMQSKQSFSIHAIKKKQHKIEPIFN